MLDPFNAARLRKAHESLEKRHIKLIFSVCDLYLDELNVHSALSYGSIKGESKGGGEKRCHSVKRSISYIPFKDIKVFL